MCITSTPTWSFTPECQTCGSNKLRPISHPEGTPTRRVVVLKCDDCALEWLIAVDMTFVGSTELPTRRKAERKPHTGAGAPSSSAYNKGCRCDECTEIRAIAHRRQRAKKSRSTQVNRSDRPATDAEQVPSRCWCDSKEVLVTPPQVRAGLTESCGRPKCVPLPTTKEAAA